MKVGTLKIARHADKLVPLPVTAATGLFITLEFSVWQGSLCVLLSLFTAFLPSPHSLCDSLWTPSSTCEETDLLHQRI